MAQKTLKKRQSTQKTLKIFNFTTTTNTILMKLATDIDLNKVFHLLKSWGITHRKQEDIKKETPKISKKDFWSNVNRFLIFQ